MLEEMKMIKYLLNEIDEEWDYKKAYEKENNHLLNIENADSVEDLKKVYDAMYKAGYRQDPKKALMIENIKTIRRLCSKMRKEIGD